MSRREAARHTSKLEVVALNRSSKGWLTDAGVWGWPSGVGQILVRLLGPAAELNCNYLGLNRVDAVSIMIMTAGFDVRVV